MELKEGDILLCKADRLIPNLIKKFTKSEWNHTALYMFKDGEEGIIEAQLDGINWKPLDEWTKEYGYEYIVYRKSNLKASELFELKERAFTKDGTAGYDLFSFVIRHPWKLLTGKWKYRGEKREMKFMICSEFVAWVYNFVDWWKQTPDDNKKYMDASKDFIRAY